MDVLFLSFILIFLIFVSAYFSASETALFSLSLTKIKSYEKSSSPRHRLIAGLVLQPRNLLVTVFMLNTLSNILIQNTTSHMFGEDASWLLKVGLPFIIMLFFGEIIPKNIGLQQNIKIANLVAPSINFIQNVTSPIRKIVVNITAPISHFIFFFLKKDDTISKEEMKHVLQTSEEHGVLNPDEAELVWGYLNFHEATAKTLMRPSKEILYYDINEPISKLIYLFVDMECSRIPVCDKSLDHVLGIMSSLQFFLHKHGIESSKDLIKLLTPVLYVPESIPAKTLLKRLDEQNQILTLVVDEYGSISGLITKEDIVEEVVGDISDLRDAENLYTKSGIDEIIASGRLELTEFNKFFHSQLISENNMMTIGGWLSEQLGEIPKSGTKSEIHGFIFQILAADPNKIRRMYIRKTNGKSKKI